MEKKFKKAVLGGTFDHLHKGHKKFILHAFSLSENLMIGLTSDDYIFKNKQDIEKFEKRKSEMEIFLKTEGIYERCVIESIDDIYGIALSEELEALFVVDKTINGGKVVNEKREELSLSPLKLIMIPSEMAEDGEIISSSRIRKGEIDREGKLFINPKFYLSKLVLPNSLREELKKPWGELVSDNDVINLLGELVTVGDVTTKKFNDLNLNQKISVIDFKVDRENRFESLAQLDFKNSDYVLQLNNPPGEITPDLFRAAVDVFNREGKSIIQILGEEDLAVLPLILAAPLGVNIFYGLPNSGLVRIIVDEGIKQRAHDLLINFN